MRIRIKVRRKKEKIRQRTQSGWPAAYRWAAMGTLVGYSAVGQAQDIRRAASPSDTVYPVRRFDIAAGSMDSVIAAFELVTDLRIELATDGIRSVSSPGVSGLYTPEQALQKLLTD